MHIKEIEGFSDVRGNLHALSFSSLPFTPKRIFVVSNVPKGETRGGHAHHNTEQLLICLEGEILVKLFDGEVTKTYTLNPMQFIHVPSKIWDAQEFKTTGSVLLVLASTEYNREDYIESKIL